MDGSFSFGLNGHPYTQLNFSILQVRECACDVYHRDGLTGRSRSVQFAVTMLKPAVSRRRQYKSAEPVASLRPRSSTATDRDDTDVAGGGDLLLDRLLRVIHDCNERLYLEFVDSTFRHACRPEHGW